MGIEAYTGYFGIQDIGLFFFFFFFFFFFLYIYIYDIYIYIYIWDIQEFGIWDIGIYFGIQVKLILGCGTNQASVLTCDFTIKVEFVSTLWYHKKNFLVCVTLTPVEIRK